MKHQKLFSDRSDLYAKVRPQYPKELYTFLASLCVEKKSAWDVACGSGQAALDLAEFFDQVQATDISDEQIGYAHAHPKVKYFVQPAENSYFADNQFDLVGVAQALHWFDYDQFWPEVKRVLKPNGIFAAWGYAWFSINAAADKSLQQNFLAPIEPYWAEQNKLLWDDYRDVPFPFERVDAPEIEMSVTWTLEELFAYLQTWSAVREYIKANGDEFLKRMYESMLPAWGDPSKRKRIPMNFVLLVGRNR
jgi:SAM-dependent methyltransferase